MKADKFVSHHMLQTDEKVINDTRERKLDMGKKTNMF